MSVEGLNTDIENQLLRQARPDCAEHCKLAQAKAKQGAGYAMHGVLSLESVQSTYAEAVRGCEGPEEIEVCGAPEGEKTYDCKVIGKLINLSFE